MLCEGMRLDRRKGFLGATDERKRERWRLRVESSLKAEAGPHPSELGAPSCPRREARQQSPFGVNPVCWGPWGDSQPPVFGEKRDLA